MVVSKQVLCHCSVRHQAPVVRWGQMLCHCILGRSCIFVDKGQLHCTNHHWSTQGSVGYCCL